MARRVPISYQPIDRYPGVATPDDQRTRSPFSTSWGTTLDELDRELRFLNAPRAVIAIDVADHGIRLDGELNARAKVNGPAVVLAFDAPNIGPLKYACDRFWHWQENLRAIVLGLESLRRVERYGIASRGEQYTGFKALPSGIALSAAPMTEEEAATVLLDLGGEDVYFDPDDERPSDAQLDEVFRRAVKRHHPDQGGTREAFDALMAARKVLLGE